MLRHLSVAALALPLLLAGAAQAKPAERPNIVYIMSDDHAYQAISAYGSVLSKLAPTPNIDRIAKNGAIFTNSFVGNSLCGPSRATLPKGRQSNEHGFTRSSEERRVGEGFVRTCRLRGSADH